jgi:hypothetical protein
MSVYMNILTSLCCCIILMSCKKEGTPGTTPPPPPSQQKVMISNLVYTPDTVPIKLYSPTYAITGTIHFSYAKGGISKLRLRTSAGTDTTISVPGTGSITSGDLTGFFEFGRPATPAHYTFEIWVIDGSGTESNKLAGSVSIIIDDRATQWWGNNPGNWPYYVMNKVKWFNNEFMAVGLGGRIETSKDGFTWLTKNSGVSNNLNGVTWTGSEYIAVGERNAILSSSDGNNWTIRNNGNITDGYLESVCASGNMFVAVGSKYSYASDSAEIFASND